jgi:CheY-like chemotaxis protein
MLKRSHHDLVLSDVMMPKMDGFKFCEEVRRDPEIEMTPIVLVTAKNEMPDKITGLEKGADDYLTKPYNLIELRTRIASMLRLKKLRSQLISREKELERIKTLEQTLIAISHHINNATAPIQGRAQLCDLNKPDSVKKLIEVCLNGCAKITKTINLLGRVITVMKNPSNKASVDFTNTSVNELLAQLEKDNL